MITRTREIIVTLGDGTEMPGTAYGFMQEGVERFYAMPKYPEWSEKDMEQAARDEIILILGMS